MRSKFRELVLLVICLVGISGHGVAQRSTIDPATISKAIAFSQAQLSASVASLGDSIKYPRATDSTGSWKTIAPSDWTSGFFPGCLWYAAKLTGDTSLNRAAMRWTEGLASQQYLTRSHDIGFIIFSSFGKGLQLGRHEEYSPVILQAARSLMTRYSSTVGCVRSWDNRKWPFPVIIDNMMNLEILFWASKHGGTQAMYDAAVSHARNTMQNHFRPDGSTYHVVSYDSTTGKILSRETHQGYADESVWARGQAWAVYGFTMAYRETQDTAFLGAAERAANWYLSHLPADKIPYWDFNSPRIPNEKKDASAAAITASALLELSVYIQTSELRGKYISGATAMLNALCVAPYLAEGTSSEAILNHSVGNFPKDSEIDVSLIYTDYYFLEALTRYNAITRAVGEERRQ